MAYYKELYDYITSFLYCTALCNDKQTNKLSSSKVIN